MTTIDQPVAEVDHHHNLVKMQQPETAKSVHVYLNGDRYFPGRKFVINRRHIADFNGFLNQVTMGMKAPFGAVRNIYTPQSGHRVIDLNQLQTGMQVVAGGVERFRKIEYREIAAKRRFQPKRNYLDIKTTNRIQVSARWRKYVKDPCQIFVYGNGDINAPALRLLLIPRLMKTWDLVLGEITEKICIRTGQAVRKLYDLNFQLLSDPSHLENGHYYIAVGTEKLKRYPYGELHSKLSPTFRKVLHPLPPIKRKPKPPHRDEDDSTYSKIYVDKKKHKFRVEETTVMGASAATGYKPLKFRTYKKVPSTSDHEEEAVFPPKPVKVKRASGTSVTISHEVHPPNEESDGVFKTERREIKAETVDDDENTKIDLPIDQIPAEEVQDEVADEVTSHHSDEVKIEKEDMDTPRAEERSLISSPVGADLVAEGLVTHVEFTEKLPEQTETEISIAPNKPNDDETSVAEETTVIPVVNTETEETKRVDDLETFQKNHRDIENDESEKLEDPFTQVVGAAAELEAHSDEEETENFETVLNAAEEQKEKDNTEETLVKDVVNVKALVETTNAENVDTEENVQKEEIDIKTTDENENVDDANTNRSITPSSPKPREEELNAKEAVNFNPDDKPSSFVQESSDQVISRGSVTEKDEEDDTPRTPVDNKKEDDQDAPSQAENTPDESKLNGEISARPASDVKTTEGDDSGPPLTPTSKQSIPNGGLTASTDEITR